MKFLWHVLRTTFVTLKLQFKSHVKTTDDLSEIDIARIV